MKIMKISSAFSPRIWGGAKFKELGFATDQTNIGEAWLISAHENGMSYFLDGEFKGKSLKDVFQNNRNLFGNFQGEYPLLSKIIIANENLSVQSHPDDEYAIKHHQQLGKPESWYVLDIEPNAQIVYGHKAKTKEEFLDKTNKREWDNLLNYYPVKVGDFAYIDTGKVHAIGKGVSVFELQRSSDITYRIYDYNRLDNGQLRELHIDDAINTIKFPDTKNEIVHVANSTIFSSKYFSLFLLDAQTQATFICQEQTDWIQLTVIAGSGTINGIKFNRWESAIACDSLEALNITGDLKIMISWIKTN